MFENIFKVIPPPKYPIHNTGDWNSIENKYKIKFPKDYKKIIENYGSGCYSNCFQFTSPFSTENEEFETFVEDQIDLYDPTNIKKFSLYPKKGGLFPFANSNRGESLFWITDGNPDSWSIYLIRHRDDEALIFKMGCEKFLVKWLRNQLANLPFYDTQRPYFTPFLNFNALYIYINYIDMPFKKRVDALCSKIIIKETRFDSSSKNPAESSLQMSFLLDDDSTEISYSDNLKYGGIITVEYLEENELEVKEKLRRAVLDLKWVVRQIIDNRGNNKWPEFNCVKTEFYKNIKELTRFDFPSSPVHKIKDDSKQSKEVLVCPVYEPDMTEGNSYIVLTDFHDKNFNMHTGYIYYNDTNDLTILNPHFLYNGVWYPIFLEGDLDKNKLRILRPILTEIFPIMYESFETFGLKSKTGVINSFCYRDKASGKIKELEYDFKPPVTSFMPEWVKKKIDEM